MNANNKESASKDKQYDDDIPVCVCGKPFITKLVSQCYNGTGVGCDECGQNLPTTDNVYHCPADKDNILHKNGYDLCIPCYNKKTDEINTDNILFQIWFIINNLNKDLYHSLSTKYQINSRKSLISKPTFEIFQFLMSINWNNFNDGTSMKLFCDKYDKLKEKHLSLTNASYKLKNYQNNNQQSSSSANNNNFNSIFGGGHTFNTNNTSFNWGNNNNNNNNNNNTSFNGNNNNNNNNSWSFGCNNNNNNTNNSFFCGNATGSAQLASFGSTSSSSFAFSSSTTCPKSIDKKIGFSVGGGPKDMNTARLNIENHQMPQNDAVSFQGIFNDYYFDTNQKNENEQKQQNLEDEKQNDGLPLFYPSYTCSKALIPKSLLMIKQHNDMIENDYNDFITKQYEYFLTVGLNSNIKEKDFKRKKLNICIVLDISGSMSSSFIGNSCHFSWHSQYEKSKMRVANECLLLLLTHLNSDDRFGLILFNSYSEIKIKMDLMKNIKMESIEDILKIRPSGGTNFESGYNAAIKMYDNITNHNEYENRLIFLTDAHPNEGNTDCESLLNLVSSVANRRNNKIYTTFIGIGIDFNSNLISKIIDVRGANQFSVHTNKQFKKKLYDEFDYFVSPMVFNLCLTLFCEGTKHGAIDTVYGSDNVNITNGEIMKIKTLFPSPPNDCGQVKGGIILIGLNKKYILNKLPYFCEVTFEDKFGNICKNQQKILFNNPNFGNNNDRFYGNLGVRKAILLIHFVLLIQDWIKNCFGNPLMYKNVFKAFKQYFQNEMKYINDNTLNKEIKILDKLIDW